MLSGGGLRQTHILDNKLLRAEYVHLFLFEIAGWLIEHSSLLHSQLRLFTETKAPIKSNKLRLTISICK